MRFPEKFLGEIHKANEEKYGVMKQKLILNDGVFEITQEIL